MAILKCKMCGGDIELSADKTFGTCEYCGSTMTFPRVDDEQRATMFNRGNHFRRTGEFDKALAVYERIVQEDENDAEAHWCCALCRFGIEYVEDPNTLEYLPTCHRASFDSFLEDVDYLAALEHSDGITKRQYQKDAAKIAEVQRGILATSQNEQPFDVFLCYKETEEDGNRTRDSLYAQDIYYQLTEQGRRVFFSRITLEDKAGTEYEPYIFAALNSAKVMILVTSSAEHANAVWVKNEWSRFLSLMRKDRSKLLLPCYRDMDPYDLPEALSVLQSYDMSKIGFIQDLIRGVNKVLNAAKPKAPVKETVIVQQPTVNSAVTPLLKRAFLFLEDGDWNSAGEYCEKVLDMDPENGEAYLGKLMTELHVRKRDQLRDQAQPFDANKTYQKVVRFGSEQLKAELVGAIDYIRERNEIARKEGIYQNALGKMREQKYADAKGLFDSISGFKNATAQSATCVEKAEILRQEGVYQKALGWMKAQKYREAQGLFDSIPGYRNAAAQSSECARQMDALKKEGIYQRAMNHLRGQLFVEARALFDSIPDYKDAAVRSAECSRAEETLRQAETYRQAMDLARQEDGDGYRQAAELLSSIPDYKDAQEKSIKYLERSEALQREQTYQSAVKAASYHSEEALQEAVRLFSAISGYKDADKQLFICQNKLQKLLAKTEAKRLKQQQKDTQDRAEEYASKTAKRPSSSGKKAFVLILSCLLVAGILIGVVLPRLRQKGGEDSSAVAEGSPAATGAPAAIEATSAPAAATTEAPLDVGSTILFGSYEQDNNSSNGKEPIEWIVLGKKEDKVLVISKYALVRKEYHSGEGDVTWETCSLRKWLNKVFIVDAFSTEESALIQSATVTADSNPSFNTSSGNDTTDRLFLLSIAEVNKYFNSNEARKCAPTQYAAAQGALTSNNNLTDGKATCWWWLRSPGSKSDYAAFIYSDGSVNSSGSIAYSTKVAVRPAMWIASSVVNVDESSSSPSHASASYTKEFWEQHAVRNTIAAGGTHTVGLKADGTVMAVGSNSSSQCAVSGWKDMVALAAGTAHTVGLKADGTVVAVGRNKDGQCNVSDWKDMMVLAAGSAHTVGLKADGTVLAVGNNTYGQCDIADWKDIVAIAAGIQHTVGLKVDGTVVAVGHNSYSINGQCDVSGWKDIVAIAAGGNHTVGLKADGTVVAVGRNDEGQCNVSGWEDIVAISAGSYHTVGLTADGIVVAVGKNDEGQCDLSDWEDIVAIAAGSNHTVGLKADGSLVAAGSKLNGQCNVSGWKDIQVPETTSESTAASTAAAASMETLKATGAPTTGSTEAPLAVGSTIVLGSYEQDNNSSNGKEPIEWIVLETGEKKMLVISKYALDCQRFETSATGVTWKSSSLRKWLNDTFINDAFSKDEQKRIKSTTVTADRNPSFNTSPGSDTTDKVFLLSIAEVNKYFNSNEERKCVPTNYVVARGALTSNDNLTDGKATCWWWLRSPGRKSYCAAFVYSYGTVYNSGSSISSTKIAVRPAMWIASGEVDIWGVVGSICGTAWNKDYPMTKISQGIYESDPLELKAGDEFRIRKDGEWAINRGIVEEIEGSYEYQVVQGGSNIKVKADGLYRIRYDENTERLAMIPV